MDVTEVSASIDWTTPETVTGGHRMSNHKHPTRREFIKIGGTALAGATIHILPRCS